MLVLPKHRAHFGWGKTAMQKGGGTMAVAKLDVKCVGTSLGTRNRLWRDFYTRSTYES